MDTVNRLPIKDVPNFFKDKKSGAIINGNEQEYIKTVVAKKRAQHLQARIENLENSINDINGMLEKICESVNEQNKYIKKYVKNKDNG